MFIRFDILKVTQAAAYLLKRHNGFITRIRLLKLLYIADRELLAETHRPLSGDRPVAMDHGPVLTHAYDLLKGEATGAEIWNRYIRQVAPYTHGLVEDPGVGKLSKAELAKLNAVVERFWWVDDWELSQYTHGFAEWQRNAPSKGGVNAIPVEHVLEAAGLSGDLIKLSVEADAETELDDLLASAAK